MADNKVDLFDDVPETHYVWDRMYITWTGKENSTMGPGVIFTGSEGQCKYYLSMLADPQATRYYIAAIA